MLQWVNPRVRAPRATRAGGSWPRSAKTKQFWGSSGREARLLCLICKNEISDTQRGARDPQSSWKEKTVSQAAGCTASQPSGGLFPRLRALPLPWRRQQSAGQRTRHTPTSGSKRPSGGRAGVGPTPHPTDGKTEARGGRSFSHCQTAGKSVSGSCTPHPTTPASDQRLPCAQPGPPHPHSAGTQGS